MPQLSNFTSKFRIQTNSSGPDVSSSKVTKRSRTTLVCAQCRRSKTRCDRAQPCSSCQNRSEGKACFYLQPSGQSPEADGRRKDAEARLSRLETAIKGLIDNNSSTSSSISPNLLPVSSTTATNCITSQRISSKESDLVDGMEYVGSTHWSAILNDIQQLKASIGGSEDILESGPDEDMAELHGEVIFGGANRLTVQQIIYSYLPSKFEIQRFLANYFEGETFIVPFIHTYHFQNEYMNFCSDEAAVNPLWLSILFSICHLASITGAPTPDYHRAGDNSIMQNSQLHLAAGYCLAAGEYSRPQKYAPEALVLYAQSKNLHCLDPSREAGTILGIAVRLAYSMGYHRDPSTLGRFTVFESEMRRRFWAICRQMDLMTAFQLGLPSHIVLSNSDTLLPRNLIDSDFSETSQVLPESRPENEATKILWFIVKNRMMANFSKVCEVMLSTTAKTSTDIFQLDQDIRQMAMTTPAIMKCRPISESIADPPFLIMNRIFIEFIHLKSLCVLHRNSMILGSKTSTRCCVDSAKRLVGLFLEVYKELQPDGMLCKQRWMLTNFTVNDFLMGTMVLCLFLDIKNRARIDGVQEAEEVEILALLRQAYRVCVEISPRSRDARRVSYAVKLTLNRSTAQEQHPLRNTQVVDTPPEPTSVALDLGEEGFGILDPFNFVGSELDDIDWSVFDSPK